MVEMVAIAAPPPPPPQETPPTPVPVVVPEVIPPPVVEPDPVLAPIQSVPVPQVAVSAAAKGDGGTGTGGGIGTGTGTGVGAGTGEGSGDGVGPGGGGSGRPPEPRQMILPPLEFPKVMRGKTVSVTFWVADDGRVDRIEVTPEIPDKKFREKFEEVMRNYRFRPARTAEGTLITGTTTIRVTF